MVTSYFYYTPELWQFYTNRIGRKVGFSYQSVTGKVIQMRTVQSVTDADIEGYFAVISVL